MDLVREMEREVYPRKQTRNMWEEAERISEERRKWRKAIIRTMGSRNGKYTEA